MTTNVFDVAGATVASDSRWSIRMFDDAVLRAIVFADDTGFDKMVVGQGACALFAGCSKLIDQWKSWVASPNKVVLPRPPVVDDFAMCMIAAQDGRIIYEHGQKIKDDKYRFAGTGAKPAHTCWIQHKDAKRAVASASVSDHYSGGEVKFFDIKTQDHNLDSTGVYDQINRAILQRGRVMYTTYNGKTVSIEEAAVTDPAVRVLMTAITKNEVSAEAPSGLDPVVWTESDVKRLDDSLEAFFGPIAK